MKKHQTKLTVAIGLLVASIGFYVGTLHQPPITYSDLSGLYAKGEPLADDWYWVYPESSPEVTVTVATEDNSEWEDQEIARIKEEKEKARKRLAYYIDSKRESVNYEVTMAHALSATPEPEEYEDYEATAYDLSYGCVASREGDRGHGITKNGTDLKGLSRTQAMTIATDPDYIPTGSLVEVIFTEDGFEEFNGVYKANDTGSAVKGKVIDVFMGDFHSEVTEQAVWDFGRRKVKVRVLSTPTN